VTFAGLEVNLLFFLPRKDPIRICALHSASAAIAFAALREEVLPMTVVAFAARRIDRSNQPRKISTRVGDIPRSVTCR